MLSDLDLCHGQLLDLPAHRLTDRDPLLGRESVTTPAALRPILDDAVYRPRRQERATLALMTRLGALRTPEGSFPRFGALADESALGGIEELRELRFSRRSSWAIRSSWRATRAVNASIWASIRNSTSTTASRPAS
jgi:hypothetical protein